jgi:hypothetical protein
MAEQWPPLKQVASGSPFGLSGFPAESSSEGKVTGTQVSPPSVERESARRSSAGPAIPIATQSPVSPQATVSLSVPLASVPVPIGALDTCQVAPPSRV